MKSTGTQITRLLSEEQRKRNLPSTISELMTTVTKTAKNMSLNIFDSKSDRLLTKSLHWIIYWVINAAFICDADYYKYLFTNLTIFLEWVHWKLSQKTWKMYCKVGKLGLTNLKIDPNNMETSPGKPKISSKRRKIVLKKPRRDWLFGLSFGLFWLFSGYSGFFSILRLFSTFFRFVGAIFSIPFQRYPEFINVT